MPPWEETTVQCTEHTMLQACLAAANLADSPLTWMDATNLAVVPKPQEVRDETNGQGCDDHEGCMYTVGATGSSTRVRE